MVCTCGHRRWVLAIQFLRCVPAHIHSHSQAHTHMHTPATSVPCPPAQHTPAQSSKQGRGYAQACDSRDRYAFVSVCVCTQSNTAGWNKLTDPFYALGKGGGASIQAGVVNIKRSQFTRNVANLVRSLYSIAFHSGPVRSRVHWTCWLAYSSHTVHTRCGQAGEGLCSASSSETVACLCEQLPCSSASA